MPCKIHTIMLHIICWRKSADANCCLNLFAGITDNNAFIIIFFKTIHLKTKHCVL